MAKKTIEQVDVRGKRVLMRVDFNVPLDGAQQITDDRRINEALPSIRSVISRGGRLILLSHLGRPKGKGFEAAFTLRPAADRLAALLPGTSVSFVEGDCAGPEAASAVAGVGDGAILVLDNVRFRDEEKSGDPAFAERLASFGDVYCNDAFGTAHRDDTTMYALPLAMAGKPRVCGLLMRKEIRYLSEALQQKGGGMVAVLGGAKVSDKMACVRSLIGRVEAILVGGAMAYTFLLAKGVRVGASRVESDRVGDARAMLEEAAASSTVIELPSDHVAGTELKAGTATRTFSDAIDEGWMGLDIGPATIEAFGRRLRSARTIVWNGPMGVFEVPPFDAGTRAVAGFLVEATQRGATSIVGGGDSAAAIEQFGLAARVSHVSTGGGASLEMLEGKAFNSLSVLDEA